MERHSRSLVHGICKRKLLPYSRGEKESIMALSERRRVLGERFASKELLIGQLIASTILKIVDSEARNIVFLLIVIGSGLKTPFLCL